MWPQLRVPRTTILALALGISLLVPARAEDAHYDGLADLPFTQGFLPKNGIAAFKDELVFQRAVQSYRTSSTHSATST